MIDFGHFDQCIDSQFHSKTQQPNNAKYVVVEVSVDSKHFHRGICLPQECSDGEIVILLNNLAPKMNVQYIKTIRQRMKINEGWNSFELKVAYFLAAVIGVVVLSSLYELFWKGEFS